MKFALSVAKLSLRKLFAEKWQLLMFLTIPMLIGGLFFLITGSGGNAKPIGKLLVTDNDKSTLSKLLIGGFNQGPLAEMFILKEATSTEAQSLMDDGDASVWLEIEEGFSEKFLNKQPTKIKLVKNPGQNILPQIAETAVGVLTDGGHYIQVLFADELRQFNDLLNGKDVSDAQMAMMSIQIKKAIESIEKQLIPPQIKAVKVKEEKQTTNKSSFMLHMFPGILFMSLLFAAQGLALEFWKDKSQGISSRLLSSPGGLVQYLNGKLLAGIVVFALIAVVIGLLGLFILKLSLSKIVIIIGWLMLSGLVLTNMMLFLCLLMPSEKSASIITSAMVFPLLMLGGSFFPFETMPKWMVAIGQYLPNGYLLQSFNQWLVKDNPLSALTVPALIAMAMIVLFWFLNRIKLPGFARS